MFDLQNSVLLFNYSDFYSLLTDSNDLRENITGRMDRIYFFSHINSFSAEWCSRFIGVHSVTKKSKTIRAAETWSDIFFPKPDITETEMDEPWYKKEEIQRLGNAGIVYCKDDFKFRSGNNFCQFQFQN